MAKLAKGRIDRQIYGILFPGEDSNPKEQPPLHLAMSQPDPAMRARSMQIYNRKRELCLRMITDCSSGEAPAVKMPLSTQGTESYHIETRDLSRRYDANAVPDEVLGILRCSALFKSKKPKYLPHQVLTSRSGTQVQISVEREELSLRDIIGSRQEMRRHGHWIIKQLLLVLIELEELGICIRGIQPKNISISK